MVSNKFSALESIEHIAFDVIVMKKDLDASNQLQPDDMMKIIRNMKVNIPIILVKPPISTHSKVSYDGYLGMIDYPIFLPKLLCLFGNVLTSSIENLSLSSLTNTSLTPPALGNLSFPSYSEDSSAVNADEQVDWNKLLANF